MHSRHFAVSDKALVNSFNPQASQAVWHTSASSRINTVQPLSGLESLYSAVKSNSRRPVPATAATVVP